jgi:hypothetical protein
MIWAMIRDGRRRLVLESAACEGRAIQLKHECGGETMTSAFLRLRARWCDLGAAILGER